MTDREEERVKELGLAGETWDWPYVFHYARGGEDGPFWVTAAAPVAEDRWSKGGPTDRAQAFDIADVDGIEKSVAGDNDGPDWVAFGLLKDGRWFAVSAGCDYTGWG